MSLGVTAKFIDSHLADGIKGVPTTQSWAFDLGALADPRLSPAPALGWPAISCTPSLALIVKNPGPDVFYAEAWQKDPIPTTYSLGYAIRLEAFDFAQAEAAGDLDHEWTRRSETWDQVRSVGYSFQILFFRYGEAWLDDNAGKRYEHHTSSSLVLDFRALRRALRRGETGDFSSPGPALDQGSAFKSVLFLGIPFQANPHLEIGIREIESRRGIRDGQKARFFFGLSL